MLLSLHNIGKKKKKRKVVGRGNGSGRGTYSTRGGKGQTARSGGSHGLKLKGFRRLMISAPKFKGMKSKAGKAQVIQTSMLDKYFAEGGLISPETLFEKKLIVSIDKPVKILVNKEIKGKFEIKNCLISANATAMIEKAGGKVVLSEDAKKKEEKE